jgi:hypothetical protein
MFIEHIKIMSDDFSLGRTEKKKVILTGDEREKENKFTTGREIEIVIRITNMDEIETNS